MNPHKSKINEDESRVYRGIRWGRTGHHYRAWVRFKHAKTGEILDREHVIFQRTVKASVTFERVLQRWGRRMADRAAATSRWAVAVDEVPWEIHLINNESAHLAAVEGFKASDLL